MGLEETLWATTFKLKKDSMFQQHLTKKCLKIILFLIFLKFSYFRKNFNSSING